MKVLLDEEAPRRVPPGMRVRPLERGQRGGTGRAGGVAKPGARRYLARHADW